MTTNTYLRYHIKEFSISYLKTAPKDGNYFQVDVPYYLTSDRHFGVNIGLLASFKNLSEFENLTIAELRKLTKFNMNYIMSFATFEELQDYCMRIKKFGKRTHDIKLKMPKGSDELHILKSMPTPKKEYGVPITYVVKSHTEHETHPVHIKINKKSKHSIHDLYSQLSNAYGNDSTQDVYVKSYPNIKKKYTPTVNLLMKSEEEIACILPFLNDFRITVKVYK